MSQTIRDVAAAARVSTATVSRALNEPDRVKPATRAAIAAAMKQLGYRPNALGRGLKMASSMTLGVLVPSLSNPVFADCLSGIEAAAHEAGYTVLLTASGYDPEREEAAISTLLSNRVAGLLLTVADADGSPVVRTLCTEGVPHVLLYNQPQDPRVSAVSVDNAQAASDVVSRLIARGHRRLGMIAGSFVASDRSRLRYQGFETTLQAADLPTAPLIEVDFNDLHLTDCLRAVLDAADAPTAVFCSNDMLALATMRAGHELGVRVPDDLSVVGFDGIDVGKLVQPSLCTVVQPTHAMGQQAVALLLDQIKGQARPRSVILPHTIRDGESIGEPPAAARSALSS